MAKALLHMDLISAKLCSRAEIDGGATQANELDALLLKYHLHDSTAHRFDIGQVLLQSRRCSRVNELDAILLTTSSMILMEVLRE